MIFGFLFVGEVVVSFCYFVEIIFFEDKFFLFFVEWYVEVIWVMVMEGVKDDGNKIGVELFEIFKSVMDDYFL